MPFSYFRRRGREGISNTISLSLNPITQLLFSNSLSIGALGGSTNGAVAYCADAGGRRTLAQNAITYTSSNAAIATCTSGGVATSVANGSCNLVATDGTHSVNVPLTVQQICASITGLPASISSDDTSSGTLTPVAKDSNNNTIAGASFTTSSNQPSVISIVGLNWTGQSAGSANLIVSSGGISVTIPCSIIHSGSVLNPTTGQYIMGSSGATPIVWDAARVYSGAGYASPDAQWRGTKVGQANLSLNPEFIYSDATKNGGVVPASSAQFAPGSVGDIDLVEIVVNSTILNQAAWRFRWVANDGAASEPPSAQFGSYIGSTKNRLWFGRRVRHLLAGDIPGATAWNITGSDCVTTTSINYNASVGKGFKTGPYFGYLGQNGRTGIQTGNGTFAAGHCESDFDAINYVQSDAGWNAGMDDSAVGNSNGLGHHFYWDGVIYDEVILVEGFNSASDGQDHAAIRYWRRIVNTNGTTGAWVAVGGFMSNDMNGHIWPGMNSYSFPSKNHNAAIAGDRYRDISDWVIFDADVSTDPWNILSSDASATPIVPQTPTANSATSTSVTVNVNLVTGQTTRSFIRKLRPVIDGVDAPAQDYTIPNFLGDHRGDPGPQVYAVTVNVAAGTHAIAFKGINGAGTSVSAASGSVSVSTSSSITALPATTGAKLARWHAGAGTSTVTVGAGVSGWTDQINGYVLAQATGANQPTYKASGINAKPSLHFDGANFYLKMGSIVTTIMQAHCIIFAIHKTTTIAPALQTLVGANDPTASTGYRLGVDNNPHYVVRTYSTAPTVADIGGGTADTTTAHTTIALLDSAVPSKTAIYSDSAAAFNADGTAISTNTTNAFGVGADTSGAAASFYSGDIAEIIILASSGGDGTANTADINAILTYARTEWGTP